MNRPQRQKKPDRLIHGKTSADEIKVDYALAPFDRRSREMDLKWGVQRLPELVCAETAQIWANTMANLNDAIESSYNAEDAEQARANVIACVDSGLRGFDFMDAEAERTGQPKADPTCWEYDLNGVKVAIMADVDAWPALRAARPDLRIFGLREAAVALLGVEASPGVTAIKEHFPDAKLKSIRPNPPVDYAGGGDPIPF